MGARRNFSRGGQNHRHFKKLTSFRRAVQKIDHFSSRRRRKRNILRFLRRFRLKYRVSIASAEGASENFKIFCRTAAYDVIFSNSSGGNYHTMKRRQFFGGPKWQTNFIAFFDGFTPWYMYVLRAPKARAKILRSFLGRQHMTSFFQIPGGGGNCPRLPPPSGRLWF